MSRACVPLKHTETVKNHRQKRGRAYRRQAGRNWGRNAEARICSPLVDFITLHVYIVYSHYIGSSQAVIVPGAGQ